MIVQEGWLKVIIIFPFDVGHGPLFEQTGIPFTEGCILPSEVEINQMVLN